MARLWMSGFEENSVTGGVSGIEWNQTNQGTAPTISSTIRHSGNYAIRFNPSSNTSYVVHTYANNGTNGPFYARAYVYIATAPSSNTMVLTISNGTSVPSAGLILNTDRTLKIVDGVGTQVGSSSAALNLNQWYRVEFQISTVTTRFIGILDGITFVSADGGAAPAGNFASILFGAMNSCSADLYFDDVAINDGTGSNQTSFPGPGAIVYAHPSAAGDNNAWFKSGGGAGDANNYNQENETPPDDSTTYVKITVQGDSGKLDDYNCDDAGTIGLNTADTISLVIVRARAFFSQSIQSWAAIDLRLKAASGGTVTTSTDFYGSTSTTWYTFNASTGTGATDIGAEHIVSYTTPGTSNPWTTSDITNMQLGFKGILTVFDSETRVSNIYAMVEFIPNPKLLLNNHLRPAPFKPGLAR